MAQRYQDLQDFGLGYVAGRFLRDLEASEGSFLDNVDIVPLDPKTKNPLCSGFSVISKRSETVIVIEVVKIKVIVEVVGAIEQVTVIVGRIV